MNEENDTIEAGSLLVIETGEYSYAQTNLPVRVIKSFSKKAAAEAFVAEHDSTINARARDKYLAEVKTSPSYQLKGMSEHYERSAAEWYMGPSDEDFLPWLVKNHYVEDAGLIHSWHVGSYGEFEP